MRLIDADKLEPHEIYDDNGFTEVVYMDDIREMPTVDTERHGQWKRKFDAGVEWYECSECGKKASVFWGASKLSKYCSNCGAKMDGVETNGID